MLDALNVSRETLERLEQFEALVEKWNRSVNLVAKSTLPDFWTRHVVDSAQVYFHAGEECARWVDLGSGGGLPGVVIAILASQFRPAQTTVLIEADKRKAAFLREAIRVTGVSAQVLAERIEDCEPCHANCLSARALAPLSGLLSYAERHMENTGTAVFLKGGTYREEVEAARRSWRFDLTPIESITDPAAAVLVIRNVERASHN
ncbi:MAG: 16S rRNA (guanine(527)-N(7))-methyltransferase RsmG [Tabrizicola sp.]|nr:16S rRNA (guanine(527)-N(7))-methyltransferase RsmG [Tabrizicola sp.]